MTLKQAAKILKQLNSVRAATDKARDENAPGYFAATDVLDYIDQAIGRIHTALNAGLLEYK